jgi:hypothetical protein
MRSNIEVMLILAASLFCSTVTVVAQTGEFVATVPGGVVHRGYLLQDDLRNARNAAPAGEPVGALQKAKPRQKQLQETMRSRPGK